MSASIDRRLAIFSISSLAITLAAPGHAIAAEPVVIYAAATLKDGLDAAATAAEASTHVPVKVVYGPTPALVKQLENQAPADIFFSADSDWMNEAVARKAVDPQTRVDLLSSNLVLIGQPGKTSKTPITPELSLVSLLGDGRLAMCDPMMMPAGRYGRAALQKLGLWDSVKDRVVDADDVRAALAYVSRGEAPLGIVFDTDTILDHGVDIIGTFPDDSHPPIVYPVGAVAYRSNPGTADVLRFLASSASKQIFEAHGYRFLP